MALLLKLASLLQRLLQKIINKTAEATGELIGNKITNEIAKPKPISDVKPSNVEEIVLLLKNKTKNTKLFKTNIKLNPAKYLNY